jgi:transposase
MNTLTIGVDISHKTFDASLLSPAADLVVLGQFANTATDFARLARIVEAQAEKLHLPIHLVMEPTGGYEQALAHFALQRGWLVSLPNPRHVRRWADGEGIRSKTDRQDGKLLTRYGASHDLPAWQPLPPAVAELEALLNRRQDLDDMVQQEENRRHALSVLVTPSAFVQESITASIARLEEALTALDAAIQAHMEQNPQLRQEATRLDAVPGVGKRNLLPLLVLLYRWGTLTNYHGDSKGLTAYAGLDPQHHQSGTSVHERSTISRQGDRQMRSLLFMSALGGVRGKNPLRDFYQRLVGAGKPKKLALTAAARKILVWTWAVFSTKTDFDPERARGITLHALDFAAD